MEKLTVFTGILVALVAWREWFTNKQRLRNELFDRRYAVYEEITGFMANVVVHGSVEPGGEFEFLRKTKKAYFVFGCQCWVKYLLDDIYKKAVKLHELQATLEGLQSDARSNNLREQTEIKTWFSQELQGMDDKFEQFFKLW